VVYNEQECRPAVDPVQITQSRAMVTFCLELSPPLILFRLRRFYAIPARIRIFSFAPTFFFLIVLEYEKKKSIFFLFGHRKTKKPWSEHTYSVLVHLCCGLFSCPLHRLFLFSFLRATRTGSFFLPIIQHNCRQPSYEG
jgi:hypothetical protein